jgi:hypothetical protein
MNEGDNPFRSFTDEELQRKGIFLYLLFNFLVD